MDNSSRKKLLTAITVLGALTLLIPFLPANIAPLGLGAFLGRLHPLVVHFPIVLVLLPLVLEVVLVLGYEQYKPLRIWLLAAGAGGALVAVWAGYFLYASGGYEGDLVNTHLWGGVGVAILISGLTAMVVWSGENLGGIQQKGYLGGLILVNLILVYTGHMGGSLTHGENFLTEAWPESMPTANVAQKPRGELFVYEDILHPVFEIKCISCHNQNKKKGGLVMASLADILQGGKSEKTLLVAKNSEQSELFHRVVLPVAEDDHMPPEGKPQMTEDEIAVLQWWIDQGAASEITLDSLQPGPEINAAIDQILPGIGAFQSRRLKSIAERNEMMKELQPVTKKLGLVTEIDPDDTLHLAVSMQIPPEKVTDDAIVKLLPYAGAITRLSLVSAEITDEGLYYLGKMSDLKRLTLAGTCIKGEGLNQLAQIPGLEVLNLSHTDVDDQSALVLMEYPALKAAYLFDTKVGENLILALDNYLEDAKIRGEEGPLY